MISVDTDDDIETLLDQSVREGWGDGLPFVPPTVERVGRALETVTLDPDTALGLVPPANAVATIRNVTVNAVMAGCRPEHLPLVFAAVQSFCEPTFNVLAIQVTTHPVGVGAFVSGPLGPLLGVNSGGNAFGPGNRANATVGRAIRLVLLNLGEGIPRVVDKATLGSPLKYSWFFGENQEDSPWPSWTERVGAEPGSTTVTSFGSGGYHNILETTASADQLLDAIARNMAIPNSNDHLFCGAPLLVLGPEHAELLADAGYSVSDVQQRLWETATVPVKLFSDSNQRYRLRPVWTRYLGELGPDTGIPVSRVPDDIRIVVSGGPGKHSVYVPSLKATPLSVAGVDRFVGVGSCQ